MGLGAMFLVKKPLDSHSQAHPHFKKKNIYIYIYI